MGGEDDGEKVAETCLAAAKRVAVDTKSMPIKL